MQAPSFQFYPREFMTSRSVVLMTPEARGGYIMLLCHAWLSQEPGVLADDDGQLAVLSGLGERWAACASMIRKAFYATSREGREVLVQRRMVEARARQIAYEQGAVKGGRSRMAQLSSEQRSAMAKAAADARWDARSMPARMPADASIASAFASEVENLTSLSDERLSDETETSLRENGNGQVRGQPQMLTLEALRSGEHPFSGKRAPRRVEVAEPAGFAEWYASYPRHEARLDAAKAYRAMITTQWAREALEANTPLWAKRWFAEDRDERHVKLPATYLRSGTWREAPEED